MRRNRDGGGDRMNLLCRKIESFIRLSAEDRRALEAVRYTEHWLGPREDIVQDGDLPGVVNLILDGWACRYKQLEDGRRQIIALFLPGDMCDPYIFLFRTMDQSIATLTPVKFARIAKQTIREMTVRSQDLAEALWWDMMVSTEIQREWMMSLGCRTATERLAHLFCELAVRLSIVGLRNNDRDYELPLTQADLGEAVGLSTVHVNRTLQDLRSSGLISLKGRLLTILDEEALRRVAMFNPNYLHVRHGSCRDPTRVSAS